MTRPTRMKIMLVILVICIVYWLKEMQQSDNPPMGAETQPRPAAEAVPEPQGAPQS